MPPEQEIRQLKRDIEQLKTMLAMLVYSDRYLFSKDIQLQDGRNIQVATGTGSRIGTAIGQKISVYGVTPVIQAGAISSPIADVTSLKTAVDAIRTALTNFGITA